MRAAPVLLHSRSGDEDKGAAVFQSCSGGTEALPPSTAPALLPFPPRLATSAARTDVARTDTARTCSADALRRHHRHRRPPAAHHRQRALLSDDAPARRRHTTAVGAVRCHRRGPPTPLHTAVTTAAGATPLQVRPPTPLQKKS
jgi:hypothetical protein